MKKINYLIFVLTFAFFTNVFGQKPAIELTFTANYYGQFVPMFYVSIQNLTKGCDTVLDYSQDTVLVLNYSLGIPDIGGNEKNTMILSQNFPNPFIGRTTVNVYLPEKDKLKISVCNILGQEVAFYENYLGSGRHSFTFNPGNEKNYFLTASAGGFTQSIKMVSPGKHSGNKCNLAYTGMDYALPVYKSQKNINGFEYGLGDTLRFIAYAQTPDMVNASKVVEDAPTSSKTYDFDVLEGVPCPGNPTVHYEGQMYTTVVINTQCWMKENMNVGTMIDGNIDQSNNNQIEKYCYDNYYDNCEIFGGLYQWDEMMQYAAQQGSHGICPPGWYIPTEADWINLINFQGGYWVAGGKMKETGFTHWNSPNTGATNQLGFTALPAGLRGDNGNFVLRGDFTVYGSSSKNTENEIWICGLYSDYEYISYGYDLNSPLDLGFSVRCLRDTPASWNCGDIFTDVRDGQNYSTKQIGTQCWMSENLNIGTLISAGNDQTNNGQIEKYCYNNNLTDCDIYGGLYQWNEMVQYNTQQGTQGICPNGWHLPTDASWTILTDFLGGENVAGGKMKETGFAHWLTPNTGATNESGFTALPGGYRDIDGNTANQGSFASFWSISGSGMETAWARGLYYNNAGVYRDYYNKNSGYSVRCLKD